MFGKHFASMYEGSMIGKGSAFFAVWGYVIAHAVPDKDVDTSVELNPKLIAFVIGEELEVVEDVIRQMQEPDPESRSKKEEGRKLIKIGEYTYQVVNGKEYRAMRDQEDRKRQNLEAQRRFREKKRLEAMKSGGGAGEAFFHNTALEKDLDAADAVQDGVAGV